MSDESAERPGGERTELEAALHDSRSSEAAAGYRAHALTDREASNLSFDTRPTVVVFAGGVSSGKTSLITAFYERFGKGPIAGRQFAGSLTLPGLEARAKGLRPQNGLTPAMPHTHRNAVPWLHLRVKADLAERSQELLLGDFDGEMFDRVVEGKDPAESIPALGRADHVMLVIDGAALVDAVSRHLARQRATDLVEVLTRPGVLATSRALSLILTKLDLVDAADDTHRSAALEAVAEIREQIARRTHRRGIAVIETAAISTTPDLPLGHGVDELLDIWHELPRLDLETEPLTATPHQAHAWFGRFHA